MLLCIISPALAQPAAPSAIDHAPAAAPTPAFLPNPSSPFLDFSQAWPTRALRSADDPIQGIVIPWDVPVSRLIPVFTSSRERLPSAQDVEDFRTLCPTCTSPFLLENIRGLTFRLGTPEEARQKGFGRGPAKAAGPDASLVFRYVSAQRDDVAAAAPAPAGSPGSAPSAPHDEVEDAGPLILQRTWFAYYEPINHQLSASERRRARAEGKEIDESTPPTKGIVLLMPGLYGTPEPVFDTMVLKLRESNMGVLRMLSQPSRFTERVSFEIDPENMEAGAAKVASILTDRAAECALAAQGAWKYLEETRPELATLPKAIIGTSGGGMTLPVVVAREPDRYAACVLIGAAADFALIARRSNYTADASSIALRIKGRRTLPGDDDAAFSWQRFDELYLAHAPLDSYHCAKAMQGKRVLMIHGQSDLAVPASLGDVLWERLGKPERWEYPTGHEGLIIEMVPRDTGKLIEWLKESGLK